MDTNGNGIQDSGEPGRPGVTVELLDCNGIVIKTTTTDDTGFYSFTVPPGAYQVRFSLPGGFTFSPANQGADDAADSDAGASGVVGCATYTTDTPTIDAGLVATASLGDFVWHDLNGDGIQSTNELGIGNVPVSLYRCDGTFVSSQDTGGNGSYTFSNLAPGSYYVVFAKPAGYVFTTVDVGDDALDSDADATGKTICTALEPGENDPTWDAGLYRAGVARRLRLG